MSHAESYLKEVAEIASRLDMKSIETIRQRLVDLRQNNGRLFFLGLGGSAANASHAVNDFRKIAGIQAFAPTDNISEFTARVNDEGWESVFSNWLKGARLRDTDMVFILSVGGGNLENNISPNLVRALDYAKEVGAAICGIVGRDGGYTAKMADACVIIPTLSPSMVTPHAESFQAVVWHLLVSDPSLQLHGMKWETV
ncbi:MAG: SIS domain-containing protein [Armatimonadota bacterium]|nr:SIS domain-containing protein [Armatimonadota bacterium]